jgi:hypothetical protein
LYLHPVSFSSSVKYLSERWADEDDNQFPIFENFLGNNFFKNKELTNSFGNSMSAKTSMSKYSGFNQV